VDYVEPLLPYIENAKMLNIMHECVGVNSRWFLAKGNKSWMLGDWEEEKETGIWYSNKGYLPKPAAITSYGNWTQGSWYSGKDKEDPTVTYTGSSKLMYISKGNWSWEQWDNMNVPKLPAPPSPKKNDKTYEIFDENNDLTTIIDIDGNVVWEKPADESIPFDCPYCTNRIDELVLSDMGECPFCYEFVSSSAKTTWNEDKQPMCCPHCGEQNYLIEPAYLDDIADTECVKCGALFDEGSDIILGWAGGLKGRGGANG
jgi:hypothetical protein